MSKNATDFPAKTKLNYFEPVPDVESIPIAQKI